MVANANASRLQKRGPEETMAYARLDQAPSVGLAPRIRAPRLAWARIAVLTATLGFWIGLITAIRAVF